MEMINSLSTGQSVSGCSRIDDDVCQAPDCTTTTEGTGWKYCTALSIANLNGVSPSEFQSFYTEVPCFADMPLISPLGYASSLHSNR
jgi:hypothetical protein